MSISTKADDADRSRYIDFRMSEHGKKVTIVKDNGISESQLSSILLLILIIYSIFFGHVRLTGRYPVNKNPGLLSNISISSFRRSFNMILDAGTVQMPLFPRSGGA